MMRKANGSRNRRTTAIVAAIAAVQVAALLTYRWVERERQASVGEQFPFEQLRTMPAPDITLVRPDGSKQQLATLRGQTVLLHFWATWCPPCREELPRLLALGRELARGGQFEVIAVSLDRDWETVAEFFGTRIPNEVFRADGESTKAYGVSELPDTYLIDPNGSLRVRFAGARDWSNESARELFEGYLGAAREGGF